jgi:Transposase DDE domain group 1
METTAETIYENAKGSKSPTRSLAALADLSGQWIDRVHGRRPPRGIVLDMDSSVSPTHGEQEMSVWNGHYACTCYHGSQHPRRLSR